MKANPQSRAQNLIPAIVLLAASSGLAIAASPAPASGGVYSFHDVAATATRAPEMALVPAGKFRIGDVTGKGASEEQPAHEVNIGSAFAVGRYEVTVAEFGEFVKATQYKTDAERGNGCFTYRDASKDWSVINNTSWQSPNFKQDPNHPAVCVSWNDAVAYTQWLSQQTGERYRLPTEAEWEYVARAGTDTNYWWGNQSECDNANCCKTGQTWMTKQTRAVGSYAANPFGLYDTAGNVWEWTASEYAASYTGSETQSARADSENALRVVRGGSWYNFAIDTRAGLRGKNSAQDRFSTVGFRVARDATAEFVKNAQQQLANKGITVSSAK